MFIELIGATMTMLSVIYAVSEKWITWIWSSLSALFYLYIYVAAGLYVSAEIQILYLIISLYGLTRWYRKSSDENHKEQIKAGSWLVNFLTATCIVALALILFVLNKDADGARLVLFDSVLVATAIVAQYLMARKYINCWVLWIIVNIGYLPILYMQELWISFGLYIFLFYFTCKGAIDWHRKLKNINKASLV